MHSYEFSTGPHHALRRTNRRSFLGRVHTSGNDTYAASVLILCYNDVEQFFRALDHLDRDPGRSSFMVTIVQNSDREESLRAFEERITKYENVTVLYPVENVGSAWGYGLGQEYLLHEWYERIIVLEDDVELLEDDVISSMVTASKSTKDIVFIERPVNAGGEHSRYVQCACYPAELLRAAGIIDARYYFRAEDLERGKRLEDTIKRDGYRKVTIAKHYYHPYLKWVNNSWSRIYFSIRNQLRTYRKHHQGLLQLIAAIVQYQAFAFLVLVTAGNRLIRRCLWNGLYDGMEPYMPLEHHKEMIHILGTYRKLHIEDLWFTAAPLDLNTLARWVNVSNLIAKTTLSAADRSHLSAFPGNVVVSGWFQPVRWTIIACMKKIFIIEQMNRDKKQVMGKVLTQGNTTRVINLLLFLPSLFLWLVLTIIFLGWFFTKSYLLRK